MPDAPPTFRGTRHHVGNYRRAAARWPGLVIGSDGAAELVVLELRQHPAPVVLVNISADGCLQAKSFEDFVAQRREHEELRWDEGYG